MNGLKKVTNTFIFIYMYQLVKQTTTQNPQPIMQTTEKHWSFAVQCPCNAELSNTEIHKDAEAPL